MRPYSNREDRTLDSWYMLTSAAFPTIWAMIDLGSLHHVTAVMVMGQFTVNKYVKTFRLSYSSDDITYTDHVDEQGNAKVRVNRDRNHSLVPRLLRKNLLANCVVVVLNYG